MYIYIQIYTYISDSIKNQIPIKSVCSFLNRGISHYLIYFDGVIEAVSLLFL